MKSFFVVLLLGGLCACAATPPAAPTAALLRDEAFDAPAERIDAEALFALTPAMQRYLDERVAPRALTRGVRHALIEALYERGELQLTYDTEQTRTAGEAFASRSGNCLSLVIMTAAFAKRLNLQVQYQSVLVDDTWSRNGDLLFANAHVNLVLGLRAFDTHFGARDADLLVVDFLPTEEARRARTRAIGEDTVIAMFMNNRAAECLALTAKRNIENGLVDDVISEPLGGAHRDPAAAIRTLGDAIEGSLKAIEGESRDALRKNRRAKFLAMGRL